MLSKVYIIGKIPYPVSLSTQKKFYNAQMRLERFNMKVHNPIKSYLQEDYSKEDAMKENLSRLMNANAVYILNDSLPEDNIEIAMAMKLNILIMHES